MATESKQHTPGPWSYEADGIIGWFDISSENVPNIAESVDNEANARLIAAAPDLLVFVEKYVCETNCICRLNKIMAKMDVHVPCTNCEAKALIRKATEPEKTR